VGIPRRAECLSTCRAYCWRTGEDPRPVWQSYQRTSRNYRLRSEAIESIIKIVDPVTSFISYSRTDADFVLRLCQDLRGAGTSIWLDKLDIRPGEDWDESIARALAECGRMVIVLSPTSVASDNVLDEVGYALSKKKPIIPILLQDCEVPYRLNRIQYIDFRNSYDDGFKELSLAMQGSMAGPGEAVNSKGAPAQNRVAAPKGKFRASYLLACVAAVVAIALFWNMINYRTTPVEPQTDSQGKQAEREGGKSRATSISPAVPVVTQAPRPAAPDGNSQLPPGDPERSPSAPKPASTAPTPKLPFKESYREALQRYIAEAPSGFRKLGAQEFVDWNPSVNLPSARSCRGSGYPRDPVIECVVYRTESEVEAANKFEDLIELTQAVLPGWKGGRMNMFVASVSNDNAAALVLFNVFQRSGHYDVVVSVRPK
jgi:hypothetical protein